MSPGHLTQGLAVSASNLEIGLGPPSLRRAPRLSALESWNKEPQRFPSPLLSPRAPTRLPPTPSATKHQRPDSWRHLPKFSDPLLPQGWNGTCAERRDEEKSWPVLTCGLSNICGPKDHLNTEGSYEPWFLESSLSWALEPGCRILMFLWSWGLLNMFRKGSTK